MYTVASIARDNFTHTRVRDGVCGRQLYAWAASILEAALYAMHTGHSVYTCSTCLKTDYNSSTDAKVNATGKQKQNSMRTVVNKQRTTPSICYVIQRTDLHTTASQISSFIFGKRL